MSSDDHQHYSGKGNEENADLMRALQLSKTEPTPLSCDGVVLLRLTRVARSPDVAAIFLDHPALEDCRNRVINAGCEITPSWASGARLLVPFTEPQFSELMQEGFELSDHHILALSSDQESIEVALKDLPRKSPPRLSSGRKMQEEVGRPNLQGNSSTGSREGTSSHHQYPSDLQDPDEDYDGPMVVVESAFPATNSSLGYPAWVGTN